MPFSMPDFGWANAGWHRPIGYKEVQTPSMNALVKEGIELDQAYSFKFCSPTRSSLQSGRLPVHVNMLNIGPETWNPADPISGFAAIPRNMTGIATKLKSAGYMTHQVGKWYVHTLWCGAPVAATTRSAVYAGLIQA